MVSLPKIEKPQAVEHMDHHFAMDTTIEHYGLVNHMLIINRYPQLPFGNLTWQWIIWIYLDHP